MGTNGNSLILDPELSSKSSRFVASATSTPPPSKHLMENYVHNLDGRPGTPELDKPRFNPLNTARPRSSALLNMNDALAMHLLVETAILDSDEYEILSYEEVDELKKEHSLLKNRIDASKRKLALENKVREAALSLSRLYSPKTKGKQRRSLGQSNGNTDVIKQTDDELSASSRRCEELAAEIWRLETRTAEIHKRLLQHCAGILGMTHHDNRRQSKRGGPDDGKASPIGSPVGHSYTVSRGRIASSSLRGDAIEEFDDRSLYRTPNQLDEIASPGANRYFGGLGLYSASRSGGDSRRFSNERVVSPSSPGPVRGHRSSSSGSVANHGEQAIAFTERRVMDLNNNLRNFLVQLGGEIPTSPSLPRAIPIPAVGIDGQRSTTNSPLSPPIFAASPGFALQEQLGLLEQGIKHIQSMASNALEGKMGPGAEAQRRLERTDNILESLWEVLSAGEEELQHKKETRQRRRERRAQADAGDTEILGDDSDDNDDEFEETEDEDELSPIPANERNAQFTVSAFSGKFHNFYERSMRLQAERTSLRRNLAEQSEANNRQLRALRSEYESRIEELSISLSNAMNEVAEVNQRDLEISNLRKQIGAMMEDLRSKDEELRNSREEFNAVMIQLDNARKEMKVLEQQQMQNVASSNADLASNREEFNRVIEQLQKRLQESETEIKSLTDRLADADTKTAAIRKESEGRLSDKERELQELHNELREASNKLEEVEKSATKHVAVLDSVDKELDSLRTALSESEAALVRHKQESTERERNLKKALDDRDALSNSSETELRELEGEVARLNTEMAVLKAELDETKSSSRQKMEEVRREAMAAAKAEAAATPQAAMDPGLLLEIENLSRTNEQLAAEIDGLKATIHEKETVAAAGTADDNASKERCKTLEKELNELLFDFEALTKQSIEFETERTKMEGLIDSIREKNESLEAHLADEKLKWLGTGGNTTQRSPGPGLNGPVTPMTATPGGLGESTSTTVLRNEFKKMMRDARNEQNKAFRAELEARRKAESELRQLRKDHQQLQKQQLAMGLVE